MQLSEDIDRRAAQRRIGCYRFLVGLLLGPFCHRRRIELPSCVVAAIRSTFPDSRNLYTGFLDGIIDQ